MKKRDSGIELLRIICVLLIILHHYGAHGGFPFPKAPGQWPLVVLQEAALYGRIACSVFVMITGYYRITSDSPHPYAKVIPLVMELCFYYAAVAALTWATQPYPIGAKELWKFAGSLFSGNWFIVYYILFSLFLPYLNPWLRSLNKKQFLGLLMLIYSIWSLEPTVAMISYVTPLRIETWWAGELEFFFVMYFTGGYLRLHGDLTRHRRRWLAIFAGAWLTLVLSVPVVNLANRWNPGAVFYDGLLFGGYNTVPAVLFAVSLFILFSNIHFYSPLINEIAASALGVYILHDNDISRVVIWKILSPNAAHAANPFVHACIKVLCVFVVCTVIDIARRKLFGERLEKWVVQKLTKI